MKQNIFRILLGSVLCLTSCNAPIDFNTDNISKIEIPVKVTAPILNGVLTIEYDSLFNNSKLSTGTIKFDNEIAYFKFDTIIDMYEYLTDFYDMDDVDMNNKNSADRDFSLEINIPDFTYHIEELNQSLVINPQDTFMTTYNCNGIFLAPAVNKDHQLEIINAGNPIDLDISYDFYTLSLSKGYFQICLSNSGYTPINDESMIMEVYNDPTSNIELEIPIHNNHTTLPNGVYISANITIPSMFNKYDDTPFNQSIRTSSLDSTINIDVSDYYIDGTSGDMLEVETSTYLMLGGATDTLILPLPDSLHLVTGLKNIDFEHIIFNYGKDTIVERTESLEIDVFSNLPENMDVKNLYINRPEIKITAESNMGFNTAVNISEFAFTSKSGEVSVINEEDIILSIPMAEDPLNASTIIDTKADSSILDASNTKLNELNILDVTNVSLEIMTILNPEDNANEAYNHNFFYNYPEESRKEMLNTTLRTEINIPIDISFDAIVINQSEALSIDSTLTIGENDSIKVTFTIWSKDFPFNASAQVYFQQEGKHIDSMFATPQLLIPESLQTKLDSTQWSVSIQEEKYHNIVAADSMQIQLKLGMDEATYFKLEEHGSTEISYKLNLLETSYTYQQD